ncbi:hypothetical protein [Escherichia phage vB_EcoM_IME392]|nr:hypothetical protein [Escherichia phage vB_EcoM_IME392]
MKIAVTNFSPCSDKSIIASNTLASWLAYGLQADLLDDTPKFVKAMEDGTKYDVIIAINGVPTFCKFRDEMYKFWVDQADVGAKFYWIGQDYSSKMRIQGPQWRHITAATVFKVVAAFERTSWGNQYSPSEENYHHINWNRLTYVPGRKPRYGSSDKPDNSLLYYGAAREGRFHKFTQYFSQQDGLELFMSVPSYKAQMSIAKHTGGLAGFDGYEQENWEELDPKERKWLGPAAPINWLPKFKLSEMLDEVAKYAAVLLIEDWNSSNSFYTSPPNRYYEYLSSGTLMLVDKDAAGTIIRSGVPEELLAPLIVSSNAEIAEKLKDRDALLKHQYENLYLRKDYAQELQDEVIDYFTKEGIL